MARRTIPPALLGPLILIGIIIWLFQKAGEELQHANLEAIVLIGLVIAAPVGLFVFARIRRSMRRKADRRSMFEKAEAMAAVHLQTLLKRRLQLLRYDPYGKPLTDGWLKELDYFVSSQLAPSLSQGEQHALTIEHDAVVIAIAERVEKAAAKTPAFAGFSSRMTPSEFEAYCAEELRRIGWQAYVTRGSRDQGIDVVATKNGVKLILQCKLYTTPVGNKAVQEAFAGKAFEGARYAAVVSNSPYTPSAQQLAATNGVLLLHYNDLAGIDARLSLNLSP